MTAALASDGASPLSFSIGLVPGPPREFMRTVQAAESAGFDAARVGDVQGTHREMYSSLAAAGVGTSRIVLGPGVTNPVTRHPAITAAAIATLSELTGGRVFLGIGTGDSALGNVGRSKSNLRELRAYVEAVRGLLGTGRSTYRGRELVQRWWNGGAVPIYVSAHGPRSLEVAGEIADGVISGLGVTSEAVDYTLSHLEKGTRRAGRRLDDVAVWFVCNLNLEADVMDAISGSSASLAALGNLLARSPARSSIPHRWRAAFDALVADYSYEVHVHASQGDSPNGRLARELGLLEYLAERFGLIGNADDVVGKITTLARRGVRCISGSYHQDDVITFIERWGADVLARVDRRVTEVAPAAHERR